jgi:hypothetical protein
MTLKSIDAVLSGSTEDGFAFSLHPSAEAAASASFADLVRSLSDRVLDLATVISRSNRIVTKVQVGKVLVSANPKGTDAFRPDDPQTWDLQSSVRTAYMAARSNDTKAHHMDADFLVGVLVLTPESVPAALHAFEVDHQRFAILIEVALSEQLQRAIDKAPTTVLPPLASWDEAHKKASGTLVHVLIKVGPADAEPKTSTSTTATTARP